MNTWSTYTNFYDASARLVSHAQINHDRTGSLTAYNYNPTTAQPWSSFTFNYVVDPTTGLPWSDPTLTVVNADGTTTLKSGEAAAISTSMESLVWYANPYVAPVPTPTPGPGDGLPVFLDLTGGGINVVPLNSSSAQFDMDGRGMPEHAAWAGSNDGILAIDLAADGTLAPDGLINQAKEINFGLWAPGASSDMEALREVFDTNGNGWLDPGDADWADFRVWVNSNGAGTGQLDTLAQLGITGINLTPSGPERVLADGSIVLGTSTFTKSDGTTGTAGDVALAIGNPVAWSGVATAPMLHVGNASGNAGTPIALSISSALTVADGTELLSVQITGVPSTASLSAGTENSDGSWSLTPAQLKNLSLIVLAGSFAGTANLSVVATATETDGSQAQASGNIAVTIAGAASRPTLSVQSASGNAGAAIALSIASALTSTDGTETLAINIAGLPSGASLSAGTHNANGSWTLTPTQVVGLTFTAAAGSFAGTASLTVTATATETDGSQASTVASLPVSIAGVATMPTLTVHNASGNAGTTIALSIASALTATDGAETLSVRITGVPGGASLSAGTHNADGSWTLTPSQLTNLGLVAPPAGSFAGTVNLTVTATATETDGSQASASASLPVVIAGVATAPTLTVSNAAGNAGAAIPLSIASALTATDGTETLAIKITNVPSSATLSAGTKNADGSWTLTAAQLSSLTFTVPAGSFAGTANLTVTATATETDGSQATRSASLPVAVTGIATAPTLSLGVTGVNSGAIPLAIAAANTPGGGTQTLSYTVTGLPSSASLSAGTKNANGSWSLTAAQISGLTMTLPAGSFTGSANLTVTATATAVDGSQASTSAQLLVADNGNNSLAAGNGIAVVLGGSGNDTLTAGSGTDMLNPGGAGTDTMVGGAGNDTFVYGLGYGSDIINNLHTNTKTDTVLFGAGITASALSFTQSGNDLLIHVSGQSGTLTIQNWFLGPSYQIGSFVLANGTAVTPTITVQGSASNNTLMAGPYETLLGGAENDTYVFDRGAGSVVVYDNATTTQTTTTSTEQLVFRGYGWEPMNIGAYEGWFNLNEIVITGRQAQYGYDNYGNRQFTGIIGLV